MSHADGPTNPTASDLTAPNLNWDRWRRTALLVAAAGGAIFVVAGLIDLVMQPSETRGFRQFFLSYLVGVVYWLSLPLGSMGLLCVLYLTGGRWGVYLRKFFEANTRTLPLLAVLFVPMFVAVLIPSENQQPYWWVPGTSSEAYLNTPVGNSLTEMATRFQNYLNPPMYIGFTVLWFLIWYGLIYLLNRWSAEAEQNFDPHKRALLRKIAGPGLIVYALTLTFAATHWVVSLEESWASTMFPVIFAVNELLSSLAMSLAVLLMLSQWKPLRDYVRPGEQIHMGSLTLALTLFWTYISFAQFMLVWVGNLPEEEPFFLKRSRDGWQAACWALGVFHFAAPFLLLLFRKVKEDAVQLRNVCLMLVGICIVDVFWWVEPSVSHRGQYLWWLMDLGALAGVGGLWAWSFLGQLRRGPLLPVHEVFLVEAHSHD